MAGWELQGQLGSSRGSCHVVTRASDAWTRGLEERSVSLPNQNTLPLREPPKPACPVRVTVGPRGGLVVAERVTRDCPRAGPSTPRG